MRYFSSTAGVMKLDGGITADDTTIIVDTVAGLPGAYPYTLVLDVGEEGEEIVDVTTASGTTLTVTRGVDGTSAQAHSDQAVIRHMITARDLREPQQHIDGETDVHGVAGKVVGTTDAQTLSRKTFVPASTGDTALSVKALTGQTRNILEVGNASGAGVPYVAVDPKGCTTIAGNGVNPPLRVLNRIDDNNTSTRFKVENSGDVTLGSPGDTTQSRLVWKMQNSSDGNNYERWSFIAQTGDPGSVDALIRGGSELARTTLKPDGRFYVKNIVTSDGVITDCWYGPRNGFSTNGVAASLTGPSLSVSAQITNNTGSDIRSFANGNVQDVVVSFVKTAYWPVTGMRWTGHFTVDGQGCAGSFYVDGGSGVVVTDMYPSTTWPAGQSAHFTITYPINQ